MASEEAASEALKYKTWVLKVSIHCEGCKKKVNRILQSIDGVYTIEVDALQNKVTVTGDVDAQTLINKLQKSNKHAELWPEKKPTKPNPSSNTITTNNNKSKSKSQNSSKDSSKSKDPGETSANKSSPPPSGDASAAAAKHSSKAAHGNKTEETAGDKPAESSKADSEATKSASEVPPVSEEKNAATESSNSPPDKTAGPANGGEKAAGGGKKKGNKGEKQNSNGDGGGEIVAKESGGNNPEAGSISWTPPPEMYHYPVYPPQPAYVMSYNTAHPSTSQAYYATPMPPVPQSYMYSPYPPPPEYPPDYYYGQPHPISSMSSSPPPPPPPPAGSYDHMFSDENPNSCNLM